MIKHFTDFMQKDAGRSRYARPRLIRSVARFQAVAIAGIAKLLDRDLKRGMDIVVASVGLLLLSPLFALIAILIKGTDAGPVLFWQARVGRFGVEFAFPKFRSMVPDAEREKSALLQANDHAQSITFKMKKDPRVTWIGGILRRFSLDELPQLWCVLVGDMTLVGPRPPVPGEVNQYSIQDRRRLEVASGLTCIWQVQGRGDIPFDEQVEMDVDYIWRRSFLLDLKLLALTLPAVLLGRGAY